jgi:hypothetical protein
VSRQRRVILAACGAVAMFLLGTQAATASPVAAWGIDSYAFPSNFSASENLACEAVEVSAIEAERCDVYTVTATNIGGRSTDAAVKVEDVLPPGVKARAVSLLIPRINVHSSNGEDLGATLCTGNGPIPVPPPVPDPRIVGATVVTCKVSAIFLSERHISIEPGETIKMWTSVTVENGAPEGPIVNEANVSGGPPAASTSVENAISQSPLPFGFNAFSATPYDEEGLPATQAGAHPEAFDTTINLNSVTRETAEGTVRPTSTQDPRDIIVDLPLGLAGSALSAPTCTMHQLTSKGEANEQGVSGCPKDTIVGTIRSYPNGFLQVFTPIYNIVPEHGVAAEFGFVDGAGTPHMLYASLAPTPSGYVLRTSSREIVQVPLTQLFVNFLGNPAAHDESHAEPQVPTFTNPADCDGEPLVTHIHMDSYANPGSYDADGSPNFADPAWKAASSESPPVTGCNQLIFEPTISATPSTTAADSPTGLEVAIKVPQTQGAQTLGTPPLRNAVVALPAGVSVNPSSANGLGACSLAQVGMSASGEPDAAAPQCPDDSKIGTVELETPALPGVLEGDIYVARQGENPFGSLLAIYIVINDPKTGVIVKLAGEVKPDPTTGQLTTVVSNSPQFPFSELRTHFFEGNRAALKTSAVCGPYTVSSSLTPWSAPESGPPATPSASFQTSTAAGGGGNCPTSPGAEPNHPAFTAGTQSTQAGAYSPLVVRGARADGDQPITQVNVTLPKGLTGKLAGIPYCPESDIALAKSREHEGGGAEEAAHPACPAASEVGVVHVGAGAGPEPFYVTGHAYLTGPYKGAPLSVTIISPAVAGPFDLGDVVVRAALDVDPFTAQITAVSDPIPTILHGIPLDIRSISLEMARHEFTLNPTNCEKMAFSGEAVGQFGTTAKLSEPFQVGGCRNLAFRPKLQISLKGSTRHAGHPALKAVLTYPKQGAYANVAGAQVNLPHSEFIDQANLNKTCTKPVLMAGACPASTVYGRAKAWTPLLEKPLEGNVYLVGGFGYKLPALVAELGGQIRVLLAGRVDSGPNHGIRNTFEAVPDAPVEKFELSMKGGPKYSLLENSEDLCQKPQKALASFTAQNGATLKLTPKIAIDCKGGKGKKGKGKKGKGHGKKHQSKKGKGAGGHGRSSRRSTADSLGLAALLGRW